MLIDELLTYLFDGQAHLLTQPMTTWLTSSRRFMAFVTTNRDKIRKKVRVAPDPETVLDVRLELETAYILLQERSLSVVYEPQRMPVISTSYKWVREFERETNGKFFYIDNSFANLNVDDIEKCPFVVPSMEDYEWDRVIDKSKLFDFLE